MNILSRKILLSHHCHHRSFASFNVDWNYLRSLTHPTKKRELKSELLKIAHDNSIKTLKYPAITTSIALRSQTKENFEVALMVLNCLSSSQSNYFAHLLELINKCLDKSLVTEAILVFSYIIEMKKTLDSLTTERLVTVLIESGELSQLDYVVKYSIISDSLLMKIAEIYIMSGRFLSYFTFFDSYLHRHAQLLPSSRSVSYVIRAIMFARLRRYKGRTRTSNEEYESLGKIFESIESYHRKLQKRDGLSDNEIIELESYFSYMQLYHIESKANNLPRAPILKSNRMHQCVLLNPIFQPSSLPYLLEDRSLPNGYNSDDASIAINDLTSDLVRLRGDCGPFLLYSRDLFSEDYEKEIKSISELKHQKFVQNILSLYSDLVGDPVAQDALAPSSNPNDEDDSDDEDDEDDDDDDSDDGDSSSDEEVDEDDDENDDDYRSADDVEQSRLITNADLFESPADFMKYSRTSFSAFSTKSYGSKVESSETLEESDQLDDDSEDETIVDDNDDEIDESEDDSEVDSTVAVTGDVDPDDISEEEMIYFLHSSNWDLTTERDLNLNRGKEFKSFVSKLKSLGTVTDEKLVACNDMVSMNTEESKTWSFDETFFFPPRKPLQKTRFIDSLGKEFFQKMSSKEIYRSSSKTDFPHDDDDNGGLTSTPSVSYVKDDQNY